MSLTWRPLRADDATAWLDLRAVVEAVDETGEHVGVDQFTEVFHDPEMTVAGFDGDELVATGHVWFKPDQTEVDIMQLEGFVRPSHRRRGVGDALLDHIIDVAATRHADRCPDLRMELHAPTHEGNLGQAALLEGRGFTPVRWFYDMRVRLADEPPAIPLPDGFVAGPYVDALDEDLRLAHNEAFADHWSSSPSNQQYWRTHMTGNPAFRPADSAILRDEATGEIAAYVLGYHTVTDDNDPRELWLGQVATRKPWRGRGIATALVSTVLHQARANGYSSAALAVDTGHTTGALKVYERCGFAVATKWIVYSFTR